MFFFDTHFSFKETIHVMRRLESGDPGVYNQKIPTTILLTPEGKLHSFGYAARDFYHDLDQKEAVKWMYFERFKMMLHNEGVGMLTKKQSYVFFFQKCSKDLFIGYKLSSNNCL